jgi:hypothetical protein
MLWPSAAPGDRTRRRTPQGGVRVPGWSCLGMKTVSDFFGIPETDFEFFRSNSPVTVFFENGIGFRNFLSESAWCFVDSFLRLPVFLRNYRICVSDFSGIVSRNFSEFSGIVSWNFFRNFPACDFFASSVRL